MIIHIQVSRSSGVVRNILPPNSTITHCPTRMIASTSSSPLSAIRRWKAVRQPPSVLAFSRFHHCSITNIVKNIVSSLGDTPATLSKYHNRANISPKNNNPTMDIAHPIVRLMMKSVCFLGFFLITSLSGGSDASAIAAKVSMIRFTHSIWVMVRGSSVPINEPPNTSSRAVTFTTNWKKINLCILRYSERPHCTALTILPNESSMSVMSLAFFATLVPEPNDNPTWA